MDMFRLNGLMLFVLLFVPSLGNAVTTAEFFKKPEFVSMRISPTGEYIAAIVPLADRSAMVVIRLSDMKQTGGFKPDKNEYFDDYIWASDKRIIFNTAKKMGNLETPFGLYGLGAMDFNGENKSIISDARWPISALPGDEDNILIHEYWQRSLSYGKLDIRTGDIEHSKQVSPIKKHELYERAYIANGKGEVLVLEAGREATIDDIYYLRKSESEPWVQIYDSAETGEAIEFIGFASKGTKALFQRENKAGGPDSIVAFDMQSFKGEDFLTDENVDPYSFIRSPEDGTILAVKYLDGKPRYKYLEPDNIYVKDHRRLSNSFKGQDVYPQGYSKDGNKAVFLVYSDTNPGDYYLYDRKSGKADLIFSRMNWINPEEMAVTKPIQFKARDGLTINGLLTLPKNHSKSTPVVLNPHGGPFDVFDTWGFDSEIQLLAANGYAVLQVNFRGSGNYGRKFEEAGYKQWGKAMQNDLTDATHWLVDQGIADPNKICIYGASYGAYAALMGAAKEPKLYACAIGNVGVYDLPLQLKIATMGDWDRTRNRNSFMSKQYFRETTETDDLKSVSPANLAANIKIPVLLGGGELDETTSIKQTKLMKTALQNSGNPAELKIYENEGHGNFLLENQLDWANRVLAFLDKTIGPKSGK